MVRFHDEHAIARLLTYDTDTVNTYNPNNCVSPILA